MRRITNLPVMHVAVSIISKQWNNGKNTPPTVLNIFSSYSKVPNSLAITRSIWCRVLDENCVHVNVSTRVVFWFFAEEL